MGQVAAAMDAERWAERKARTEAWNAERAGLEAIDAPVDALDELAEALARGALMLGGYHRHNRGEWRYKREQVTHFSKCEPHREK